MRKDNLYFTIKKEISSIELAMDYLELVSTSTDHDKRNLQRAIDHLSDTKKSLENLIRLNKKESTENLSTK